VGVEVGDQHLPDELVEVPVLLLHGLELGREGADEAIGQEHAQEGAHQGAADHLAQDLGRLVDRGHGLDDPQHRRDDTERGQRVGDRLERVRGVHGLVVVGLHPALEDLLHLVGVVVVHGAGAQRVADQRHRLLVGEDARVALEEGGVLGILDMRLERDGVRAAHPDQGEEEAQEVAVVVGAPARAAEHLGQVLERVLDGGTVVGDGEGTRRGAADHHQLEGKGVQDDAELAPCEEVAARTPSRR
jgi:hypothetical protein